MDLASFLCGYEFVFIGTAFCRYCMDQYHEKNSHDLPPESTTRASKNDGTKVVSLLEVTAGVRRT